MADATNSGICSPDIECFIQIPVLALHQNPLPHRLRQCHGTYTSPIIATASERGSNLFGGILDRCVPSPFAEVYLKKLTTMVLVSFVTSAKYDHYIPYLHYLFKVCFCNSDTEPVRQDTNVFLTQDCLPT